LSLSQIQSVHIRKERVKDCEGRALILQKKALLDVTEKNELLG